MRLVQVRYRKNEYMCDETEIYEKLFTVDANSDGEAEQKVYDYFEERSEQYSTTYDVLDCDAVTHIS